MDARWARIIIFAGGMAATVGVVVIAAFLISQFGLFDVSAATKHPPGMRWLAHRTMIRSVRRQAAGIVPPKFLSAKRVLHGYCEYREHCQSCHGGPAVGRPEWADGMNPTPPYLLDARGRWSPGELFWIVSNGVKMTAMPAWKASMPADERWDVVGYLEAMPRMPPRAFHALAVAGACKSNEAEQETAAAPSPPLQLPPPVPVAGPTMPASP